MEEVILPHKDLPSIFGGKSWAANISLTLKLD